MNKLNTSTKGPNEIYYTKDRTSISLRSESPDFYYKESSDIKRNVLRIRK